MFPQPKRGTRIQCTNFMHATYSSVVCNKFNDWSNEFFRIKNASNIAKEKMKTAAATAAAAVGAVLFSKFNDQLLNLANVLSSVHSFFHNICGIQSELSNKNINLRICFFPRRNNNSHQTVRVLPAAVELFWPKLVK